jgi:hypothetical protein
MNTPEDPIQSKLPSLFLIHGRDHHSRDAIATLVRSFGIEVITWSEALTSLPFNKHDVWSVVRQGFSCLQMKFLGFSQIFAIQRMVLWNAVPDFSRDRMFSLNLVMHFMSGRIEQCKSLLVPRNFQAIAMANGP